MASRSPLPAQPALPSAAEPVPPTPGESGPHPAVLDGAADTERAHRGVEIASYGLMAGTLLLVMWRGLLPGLLCVCLGFLLTRALTRWFASLAAPMVRQPAPAPRTLRLAQIMAAALVMLLPLVLLGLGLTHSRGYLVAAPHQYQELLTYMARTVLELRQKLPADMASHLPDGAAELQRVLASYLGAKAGALAMAGRAWLAGVLFAYVGLLIGALAAVRPLGGPLGPLAEQLRQRILLFGEAFRQIVAAQFWIAAFNTLLTALFLLFVLPWWGVELPYTPVLITFTFVAGLVPIVGNLVCNAVLTIVGLSVSPLAAAACLGFLILIHKAEYVINAKVVGRRTQMGVWELLSVMFVAEAVFGPAGLVAAPLFYAYLKKELVAARLV
ncbi:MAG: permease [Acidovorax sp.]|uniref:AI-2E family transporter n=1 Tax=Acidovorax sp. TaxID=1872122 RepID=UPI0025BD9E63|nr:permease [Acidovorax sp.]MCE1192895.1 permease [Acidovorax sp.]